LSRPLALPRVCSVRPRCSPLASSRTSARVRGPAARPPGPQDEGQRRADGGLHRGVGALRGWVSRARGSGSRPSCPDVLANTALQLTGRRPGACEGLQRPAARSGGWARRAAAEWVGRFTGGRQLNALSVRRLHEWQPHPRKIGRSSRHPSSVPPPPRSTAPQGALAPPPEVRRYPRTRPGEALPPERLNLDATLLRLRG